MDSYGGFLKWGYPINKPIYRWNFHEINHPAIGDAPIKMETSILWMVAKSGYHQLIGGKLVNIPLYISHDYP